SVALISVALADVRACPEPIQLSKKPQLTGDLMITNTTSPAYTGRRVVIVGGGVAGLSLARALKTAGPSPLVIERSRDWPDTGTADYLPANAVRALDRLGIGDDVAAAAHPIRRQR